MTLSADILSDLSAMVTDWDDVITIGGTEYNCLYDSEYVEVGDSAGFFPVVTMTDSDVSASSVSRGTSVTVTSVLASITGKAFTVRIEQPDGTGATKLVLEEV